MKKTFKALAGVAVVAAVFATSTASTTLDAVSVTAIPEPEIYAMMAAGLGLMGFVAWRRKLVAI